MEIPTPTGNLGRFVVPDVVASHFHLREGDTVADFGAGSGAFVPILSRLVGPTGRVYACEIQKNLVETIGEMVRSKGLGNTEPLWCDLEATEGSRLAADSLDAAILVNTLFQIENKPAALTEIVRTLRSGGKLFVVDWSESFGGLGPQPSDVIQETETRQLLESHGLVFDTSFDAGDHHYGLAFRKA
jgi:ubiquinone/menaquinone biosynthesis C-methylase UbiE